MQEIWMNINKEGFENIYEISNFGRIRRIENKKIRKLNLKKCGYYYISLHNKGKSKEFRVHILVAEHFLGSKPFHNSIVGHIDNNKTNNRCDNLYWTTIKDNTIKAVNDGAINYMSGENNSNSIKIKVISSETLDVVGVYSSIKECSRHVKNVTASHISKSCKKGMYKTRSKKYIYTVCSDDEFKLYEDRKNIMLNENIASDKRPVVFKVFDKKSGKETIYDNQTTVSKHLGISQAKISHYINSNMETEDYKFEKIEKIDFNKSTSYENMMQNIEKITIRNVFTKEVVTFDSKEHCKKFLELSGHDIKSYKDKKHLINSEWELI